MGIDKQKTGADILPDVKKALTEGQYKRLEGVVSARHNVLELAGMNLDSLKRTLRPIIESDPEKDDILSRLDTIMPGMHVSTTAEEKPQEPKFLDHPVDYVTNKIGGALGGAKKAVTDAPRNIAVAALGKETIDTIESAKKAKGFIDRLLKDPMGFLKDFISVIFSGDFGKIKAFFSSTTESLGISPSIIEKFSEKWLPSSLIQGAKSLFSLESFSKMNYSDVQKIWKKYQKNPKIDFSKEFGISAGDTTSIAPLLENIFGKNSKKLIDQFVMNGGEKGKIGETSMSSLLQIISKDF